MCFHRSYNIPQSANCYCIPVGRCLLYIGLCKGLLAPLCRGVEVHRLPWTTKRWWDLSPLSPRYSWPWYYCKNGFSCPATAGTEEGLQGSTFSVPDQTTRVPLLQGNLGLTEACNSHFLNNVAPFICSDGSHEPRVFINVNGALEHTGDRKETPQHQRNKRNQIKEI